MILLGVSVRQGVLGSIILRGSGCVVALGLIADGRLSDTFSRCRVLSGGRRLQGHRVRVRASRVRGPARQRWCWRVAIGQGRRTAATVTPSGGLAGRRRTPASCS